MGLIPPFIGAVIFTIVQFIVFLFTLVGTPISQMDSKGTSACLTLWGSKSRCSSTQYTARGISAFGCGQRRNNMNGGAAFALFSIVTTLVALIFGVLMLLKVACAVVIPLIFTWLSVATLLVCWACVAGAMTIRMCSPEYKLTGFFDYGAGFALIVTAWCLQLLNAILLTIIAVM